jgi:hypothetical protein
MEGHRNIMVDALSSHLDRGGGETTTIQNISSATTEDKVEIIERYNKDPFFKEIIIGLTDSSKTVDPKIQAKLHCYSRVWVAKTLYPL